MKKRIIAAIMCLMLIFSAGGMNMCALAAEDLFVGDMGNTYNSLRNFTTNVQPDTSSVTAKYNSYDANRGNSVKMDIPADTTYCITANMEQVSTDNAPIVAADLTLLLTDIKTEKQIILNTLDETLTNQPISLLTITNTGALMLGDTAFSVDDFKFGAWSNGHYNLKIYYFAKFGKVGVTIQKLKYAAGTPVDSEWTFTADTLKSKFINSIGMQINNDSTGTVSPQLFKFNLNRLSDSDVPDSIKEEVYPKDSEALFVGNMGNSAESFLNFTTSVQPETSSVTAKYNTYDANRGNSVKMDIPAGTTYSITSNMESVNTDDAPITEVDLTVLLTDLKTEKQVILNTQDETSASQTISLMKITTTGALMLGDTTVSADFFKFGTWANGHYNLKLYYFAKLGKVGINIQKLKYAAGTPVDKEWTFTATTSKSNVINSVCLQINNSSSDTITPHLFKFDLLKLSEKIVPESIINSQRLYDFNDLGTKTIKNSQTSGFHTSYYGWYTQNTNTACNVSYAEVDNKKVLNLYSDGTKSLELVKRFDLVLNDEPVIEADLKLAPNSVGNLTIRGALISNNNATDKAVVRFEEGKAKLLNSVELSGFEYDKWFRISVYIDNTGATPYIKGKLTNLETGEVSEAKAQFDFINTIKFINTFKIGAASNKVSSFYVDNISFAEKKTHRVNPDFEKDSTIYSDEVSFVSTTFNIDKSTSSVKLNGVELAPERISIDEFNKIKIKGLNQNTDYTIDYKLCNYWGDEANGSISFNTAAFYDFAPLAITGDASGYYVSTNGRITTSTGNKAQLIIAAYDKTANKLLAINITPIEEANEKADYSSSLTMTNDITDCNVKAFLWTDECKPICVSADNIAD